MIALTQFRFCVLGVLMLVGGTASVVAAPVDLTGDEGAALPAQMSGQATAQDKAVSDYRKALHLVSRASFGPRPGDVDIVKMTGVQSYVEQQLYPDTIPVPDVLTQQLAQYPTQSMAEVDLVAGLKSGGGVFSLTVGNEMAQAKIVRAVLSPAQLQEVMTDFWFNHFNVYQKKNLTNVLAATYEQKAIRPYIFGKFKDMLMATAMHPAMLTYLDNHLNTASNINENYAREIMELHTVGLGYTQQDVTNMAHILTGWGLTKDKSAFAFQASAHDAKDWVVLGQKIPAGGIEQVQNAINMLAARPETAEHISYQLAQYFVADAPPKTLVKKMAATFLSTGGDLREVYRTLFYSDEFMDRGNIHRKFKSPFKFAVSAVRATNLVPKDYLQLMYKVSSMGEPLYTYLTPNGYPNSSRVWLSPYALLQRIQFGNLYNNSLGNAAASSVVSALGTKVMRAQTLAVANSPQNAAFKTSLLLGSPEFLRY